MSPRRRQPLAFLLGALLTAVGTVGGSEVAAAEIDGQRVALIVGNSRYTHHALPFAVADATAVATALRELGFEVTLRLDVDLETFERAVNRFVSDLEPAATAVFYYAGHSLQIEGENFLVAIDTAPADQIDAKYQSYPVSRVLQKMEARSTRVNLVIVDAFRSLPFPRLERSVKRGAAIVSSSTTGSFVAFSTSPGRTATDPPDGEHSFFAHAFLEALKAPGLTVDQLFKQVREAVNAASAGSQVPWQSSSLIDNVMIHPPVAEPLQNASQRLGVGADDVDKPPVIHDGPTPGKLWVDPVLGIRFRSIPPGSFTMGSPVHEPGRSFKVTRKRTVQEGFIYEEHTFQMGSPESPQPYTVALLHPDKRTRTEEVLYDETQHRVTLSRAFLLAETEITQGQWHQLMETKPAAFKNCGEDCPVERINRFEAMAFANTLSEEAGDESCYILEACRKTPGKGLKCRASGSLGSACSGYRLPTEAEWEYAARAQTTTPIYSGSLTLVSDYHVPELDAVAWYGGNSGVSYRGGWKKCSKELERQYPAKACGPHRVGSKDANDWGLHDMLGNVVEWVDDLYGPYAGPAADPVGPPRGFKAVARGCGWLNAGPRCRAASRFVFEADRRENFLGFRLARTLGEAEVELLEGSD